MYDREVQNGSTSDFHLIPSDGDQMTEGAQDMKPHDDDDDDDDKFVERTIKGFLDPHVGSSHNKQ